MSIIPLIHTDAINEKNVTNILKDTMVKIVFSNNIVTLVKKCGWHNWFITLIAYIFGLLPLLTNANNVYIIIQHSENSNTYVYLTVALNIVTIFVDKMGEALSTLSTEERIQKQTEYIQKQYEEERKRREEEREEERKRREEERKRREEEHQNLVKLLQSNKVSMIDSQRDKICTQVSNEIQQKLLKNISDAFDSVVQTYSFEQPYNPLTQDPLNNNESES